MIKDHSHHDDESLPSVDLSVPWMHYDPSDLGSLIFIQIIPMAILAGFFDLIQCLSSPHPLPPQKINN